MFFFMFFQYFKFNIQQLLSESGLQAKIQFTYKKQTTFNITGFIDIK